MSDDIVIRVDGLWKRYGLPLPGFVRQGRHWLHSLRNRQNPQSAIRNPQSDDGPWALKDINLEVRRGETLGIIGRNGAGKSTLLKVLAGVTPPTRGKVDVRGRVFPMIELNAGLHAELTGRENVRLLGAIIGFSRREIEAKMPEIEEFCELGEWFDKPVRMYSSGMLARLGFGVAVNAEADILLIDEVLAVGDLQFQNKSLSRMKEIRERGSTIVLVSHSLDQLQYLTQRAILLEHGQVIGTGDPMSVLNMYERYVFLEQAQKATERRFRKRRTTGEITFESVHVLDKHGNIANEIQRGQPFGLDMVLTAQRRIPKPSFQFSILTAKGIQCVWRFSDEDGLQLDELSEGRHRIRVWLDDVNLANGHYEFTFALRDGLAYQTLERFHNLASFVVTGTGRARGIVDCNCKWEYSQIETPSSVSVHTG